MVNRTILARTHVIPALDARKLAQLSAEEVDQWLAATAKTLSTDTLRHLLSILRQSIRRAKARDFTTQRGTPLDAANVRRAFRQIAEHAGLHAEEWTPRELRHSFVSLLSSAGIPIEDIAHLVGHANTRTTEKVYRKELRPVLRRGAKAMDDLFNAHRAAGEPPTLPPASSENQTER